MFENLFKGLGIIAFVCVLAVISGTILYWIWPIAIPAAFPGLVAKGIIAAKLKWWAAVCLSWTFNILFGTVKTNNNKEK